MVDSVGDLKGIKQAAIDAAALVLIVHQDLHSEVMIYPELGTAGGG